MGKTLARPAAFGKRPNPPRLKLRPTDLAAALAASLAFGVAPFLDRERALPHAISGFAARHGFTDSGIRERLAAQARELGGWPALDLLQAAIVTVPVLFGFLVALLLLARVPHRFQAAGRGLFLLAAATLFALGLWNARAVSASAMRDPRLLAPTELLALAAQTDGRIFFDAHALHHAAMFAPGKLEPGMDPSRAARLSASTADWRAEDRENPFAAVVLTGRNAQSTPLAQSLRTLPGWTATLLDNHGVLFLREKTTPRETTPETVAALHPNPRDRAIHLAQAALVQQSAGNPVPARRLLQAALEVDPQNAQVLTRSAMFAAQEGRWRESLDAAQAALALDPRSLQAAHLRALALLETGAVAQAAERINALAAAHPADPVLLSLQARTARVNNDPATETQALENLLRHARRHGTPTGPIHALLGQAWARRGFPDQARQNLEAALEQAPPADQRATIQETLDLIRQRTR